MRIQVLGPGCSRCMELTKRTESAAQNLGLEVPVEKVSDLSEIMKFGIMITPALVIDGTVKIAGRVPSEGEIQGILKELRGGPAGPLPPGKQLLQVSIDPEPLARRRYHHEKLDQLLQELLLGVR